MKRIVVISTLLVALAAAGFAHGAISVFKTSFSDRADYRSIEKLSGNAKNCGRSWREKSSLGVSVRGGKEDCALSSPVEGDSKQPDHIVKAIAKVTKRTDRKVREAAYVGVTVRANRKEGYELRIFPKTRRWQFLKSGEVLEEDRDKRIEGLAKKNRLEISALGDSVTVKVNGKRLAGIKDKDAEQVGGRKTGVTYGDRKSSKKAKVKAFFDKLKVQVPTP